MRVFFNADIKVVTIKVTAFLFVLFRYHNDTLSNKYTFR